MNKNKVLSLCLAGAMMASVIPASAAYEDVEILANPLAANIGTTNVDSTLTTDDANASFTVGGKSYTLLDTDAQGNFLVIAQDYYGPYAWWNETQFDTGIERLVDNGDGSYSVFQQMPEDMDFDAVKFNPAKEGTLAYYLNNDFYNGSNLADDIKSHIITKNWTTEQITLGTGSINWNGGARIKNYISDYDRDYLARFRATVPTIAEDTVSAKIVIPSYSEYIAYKDKIGASYFSGWYGQFLRTVCMHTNVYSATDPANGDVGSYLHISPLILIGTGSSFGNANSIVKWEWNQKEDTVKNRIRPMFWLDKDFFKEVAIDDVANAGSDVLDVITSYEYTDLNGTYSSSELEAIGFDIPDVWAGYGNYPTHVKGTVDASAPTKDATDRANYLFNVDGKNFVLLDRDAQGNYLVFADDDYGQKPYILEGASSLSNTELGTASDWIYDPENTNSVAYWLNNDFLTNGNGNYKLPDGIVDNIITNHQWQVENTHVWKMYTSVLPDSDENPTDNYQIYLDAAASADTYDPNVRTFNAGVVLPSMTEWKAYNNKMFTPNNGGMNWETAFMTRTTNMRYYYNNDTDTVEIKHYFYRICNKNNDTQTRLFTDGDITNQSTKYRVRPMFWLDKDFFKNVDVTVDENLGSAVITQITQYTVSDLANAGYSYEDLVTLGYDIGDEWLGYGKYPTNYEVSTAAYIWGTNAPGDAPAANVFTVANDAGDDERRFVLLDRDTQGNYLVIADEDYGTHAFTTMTGENINDNPAVTDDEWTYDPTDTNSVAYWLNNDFLTSGNGGKIIPSAMQSQILTRNWKIENDVVLGKGSVDTSAMTPSTLAGYNAWLAGKDEVRTVSSKISFISLTEFNAYKDKLGATAQRVVDNWAGYMTRTANSYAKYDTETGELTLTNRFSHICGSNGTQEYIRYCIDGNLAARCQNAYLVRPMFWLDKDFFKTVKVESAGTKAAKQILQYNIADLMDLYTTDELEEFGFDVDLPVAENLTIGGQPMVGMTLEAAYTFTSATSGSLEQGTAYQWYSSANAQSGYTAIDGATAKTYTLTENELDKYIKVIVIPTDANGVSGARSEAVTATAVVEYNPVTIGDIYFTSGGEWIEECYNGDTEITANYEITNTAEQAIARTLIIVLFDASGKLVKTVYQDTDITSGTDTYTVTIDNVNIGANYSCKAMVWDSIDGMKPYAVFDI